jgi:hypothetical protein
MSEKQSSAKQQSNSYPFFRFVIYGIVIPVGCLIAIIKVVIFFMQNSHSTNSTTRQLAELGPLTVIALTITGFCFFLDACRPRPAAKQPPAKHDPEAVLQEIKSEEMRRIREFERASRERSEAHERIIETTRERRAKEIEALEQELAHYKNIPGESNEDLDE